MILYFWKEEKKKEIYIQLTTVYSNIIITGLGIHSFALLSFLFRSSLFHSLLFSSSLFCSNRSYYWATVSDSLSLLFKKEHLERITLVTINNRATMSNSLRSLMMKENPWANRSSCSVKKNDISNSLVIRANSSQKCAIPLKILFNSFLFLAGFHCFSSFYAQERIASPCSSLSRSLLMGVSCWRSHAQKSRYNTY